VPFNVLAVPGQPQTVARNALEAMCLGVLKIMKIKEVWGELRSRVKEQWIVCRVISDRKSVQYGIRFSYPIYMSIVFIGVFSENPYLLSVAALIAIFGMILLMHPFDYVYNHGVAKLIGTNKIPGRGSELQVNSSVALVFTIFIITLILFRIPINYSVLAIIYILSSIFFLCIFLFRGAPGLPTSAP
jgi:hypothetical protein